MAIRALTQLSVVLIGWMVSALLDPSTFLKSGAYPILAYSLLAVGLYGSVSGIDRGEALEDLPVVLKAITLGVLGKAVIAGCVLFCYTKEPVSFLFGLCVAQIDPISVAALTNERIRFGKLSAKSESILRAWASFDDPMTVLLSIVILDVLLPVGNLSAAGPAVGWFLVDISTNLVFCGTVYVLFRLARGSAGVENAVLVLSLIGAVILRAMFAIAVIGLFLRPQVGRSVVRASTFALYTALFLMGLSINGEVQGVSGLVLAAGVFVAHACVAMILLRHVNWWERVRLACAHQNGLTAILLALVFQGTGRAAIEVVGPAVIFVNGFYFSANWVLDRCQITRQLQAE